MSGHNRWSKIKHKKEASDSKKSKMWTKLIKELTVSARVGGGDINGNPRLRTAVDKARVQNMPNDTIDRAIKRGTGDLEGVHYEQVSYEGYTPNGVAVIVEVLTDNRNRTGSEVKNVFTRYGGSLAEPGAVAWQFHRKGMIIIDKTSGVDEDELMLAALEAGAEDVADQGDTWDLTTAPTDFIAVRDALTEAGLAMASADLTMIASTAVPLTTEADARKVLRVLDALEDNDDVQNVYANFDIPDEIFQAVSAE